MHTSYLHYKLNAGKEPGVCHLLFIPLAHNASHMVKYSISIYQVGLNTCWILLEWDPLTSPPAHHDVQETFTEHLLCTRCHAARWGGDKDEGGPSSSSVLVILNLQCLVH